MRLLCKYAEEVLAPSNAFMKGIVGQYETLDGVRVSVQMVSSWNNSDGSYDFELDGVCYDKYRCSFQAIKSIWFGRLGLVSDYWHLVKLIKI